AGSSGVRSAGPTAARLVCACVVVRGGGAVVVPEALEVAVSAAPPPPPQPESASPAAAIARIGAMRLRLDIEYDGTEFAGWAEQPGLRTVEGTLREALGQVASVDVEGGPPPANAAEALNTVLPDDVAVTRAEEAGPDFDARRSA